MQDNDANLGTLDRIIDYLSARNHKLDTRCHDLEARIEQLEAQIKELEMELDTVYNGLRPGGKVTIGTGERTPRILQEEG